jgi:hypothetical protein
MAKSPELGPTKSIPSSVIGSAGEPLGPSRWTWTGALVAPVTPNTVLGKDTGLARRAVEYYLSYDRSMGKPSDAYPPPKGGLRCMTINARPLASQRIETAWSPHPPASLRFGSRF